MVDSRKTDAARADSIIRRDSAESDVARGSVHDLWEEFWPGFSALFDRYPIEEYISLLDATPKAAHYHHITEPVLKIWQDILSEEGAEALEIYNRATMLTLIDAFETRAARRDYPPSIIDQFRNNFSRIEEALQTGKIGTYVHTSDDFLKDFAICRQKVFPVRGAQVSEAYSGVPRSIIFAGGIGQFFRALFMFMFVTRGHKPVYRTHTHLSTVSDFTTDGRDLCFVQLAEMLERHPEVKGWIGGSWLYDPALGKISPRLADLCGRPASNGGWVFYVKDDHSGGAISKSATRRKLYEEGKYQPKSYTVVWPREKLMAWAKRR